MADDRSLDLRPGIKFLNVLLLGFTFMLVFTGFQTCGMVEQTVLESYKQIHPDFNGVGYTSLAIIYTVFAVANWVAPSIVSIIGPKYSMIISAVTYTAYIATFIKPMTVTLYLGSVLIGIGAAVLWTAQGNFLTLNSDDHTMGRNSGIFWALLQCSLLIGNLYVYFAWRGVKVIKDAQRVPLFIGLTAISGVGTILMFFLRSHPKSGTKMTEDHRNLLDDGSDERRVNTGSYSNSIEANDEGSQNYLDHISEEDEASESTVKSSSGGKASGAWMAFLKAIELFKTTDMMLLSITFLYTGFELTFFSGVYATSVGATLQFGEDADKYVGLTGIMIGVGEIFGGLIFGIFGRRTVKYGRSPVVFLGFFLHLAAFFLIFLNIPDEAPLHQTHEVAYIDPNVVIAIGCGFLLGFGDACFNTQCFSILGVMYKSDSAPAFALFKFEQSLAAAIGFFYSNHIVLKWQLLIMVVFGVSGTLTYFKAEHSLKRRQREEAINED
ncbi:UNC93-like protein MFSD11 isoform X2 [Styela clava]|uniref:UNC93-like protein MFSD11 isoform X2 n=1 Tax=Styela clava TaxID=7725 RepID=UPI00193A4C62|nr:UNC93-like protein MFSD11 isoform X2 [Styela clava]